jgi:hypothetical protein
MFIRSLCSGYVQNNQAHKAIDLFNEITNPDEVIINLMFNACAQLQTAEALNLTKKIFKEMPKSFHSNLYVLASAIYAFMKCGDVANAQSLFDTSKKKTMSMYGAMMKGKKYFCLYKYVQLKSLFRLCTE